MLDTATTMTSEYVCCDANLVVRFVSDGDASAVHRWWQQWLRSSATIVAPSLFRYEVTNAFHRLTRADNANRDPLTLLSLAFDLPISAREFPGMHDRAIHFARRFDLPAAYDSHYLALAESLHCRFFTSDARLFNSVSHQLPWVEFV